MIFRFFGYISYLCTDLVIQSYPTMKLKHFLAITALGLSTGLSAANSYGIPDEIPEGNILHCFDWKLSDIKAELPTIAEAGFGAVQISPMQGNAQAGAEWYYAYLPYDMNIRQGGIGAKTGLIALCQEAEKYGIKVIVDVVANHINGSSAHRAEKWNNTTYWHSTTFKNINYGNRGSITHDNLGDYPDLNSEHADVQAAVKAYVEELKECGVKGIRWDAAKHIGLPSESCNFWPAVTSVAGMWHYGEILDSPGGNESVTLPEYMRYMSVTDTRYSNALLNSIRSGQAPTAYGNYTASGYDASKLVYWAESHDTYADGSTSGISQGIIDRAWALGACRQGAVALYLSRPLVTGRTNIKFGVKGSTAFTAAHIAAVNHLRNAMGDTPEYFTSADGVACVTRAGGGACIVVGNGQSRTVSVSNGGGYVPAGTYKDEVSGNTFTVTATTISGKVGSTGIAVIYDTNALKAPRVDFTPGGSSFRTPTLTVRATLANATEGWCTVNGGNRIAISAGGTDIVLGNDIEKGEIKVQWTAVSGNDTRTGTLTYTKIDPNEVPADMPEKFYIVGEINSLTWDPSKGVEMTRQGGSFTATVRIRGYFSFARNLSNPGDWNSFNADGNRWGVAADTNVALGQSVTLVQLNDPKAVSTTGTSMTKQYTVTVNWSDKSMTVTEPAGIEDVVADDNQPVEYYTIDGIKVDTPARAGIYIVRRGNTVTKQYIR